MYLSLFYVLSVLSLLFAVWGSPVETWPSSPPDSYLDKVYIPPQSATAQLPLDVVSLMDPGEWRAMMDSLDGPCGNYLPRLYGSRLGRSWHLDDTYKLTMRYAWYPGDTRPRLFARFDYDLDYRLEFYVASLGGSRRSWAIPQLKMILYNPLGQTTNTRPDHHDFQWSNGYLFAMSLRDPWQNRYVQFMPQWDPPHPRTPEPVISMDVRVIILQYARPRSPSGPASGLAKWEKPYEWNLKCTRT